MLTSLTPTTPRFQDLTRPTTLRDALPNLPQTGFTRIPHLAANLDLSDGWAGFCSGQDVQAFGDPQEEARRAAAARLQTGPSRETPAQDFTGRTRDGVEVPVHLDGNGEARARHQLQQRIESWTDRGLNRQQFEKRAAAAADHREECGLVRVDEPGASWAAQSTDRLNCRGDALRPWTGGDHAIDQSQAGLLMNALGATDVPQEESRVGDLVGFGVAGRPGEPGYRLDHLGTVVGHDPDGMPLVGGRDGEYGVWLGRLEDWQEVYPGSSQTYRIPQGARLERR